MMPNAVKHAATMELAGDWDVLVTPADGPKTLFKIEPQSPVVVANERHEDLPDFDPAIQAGWRKGAPLAGVRAHECTARYALDPASLEVFGVDGTPFQRDRDYAADLEWGCIARLPDGRIGRGRPVCVRYAYTPQRLDSIIQTPNGELLLRPGSPHIATPLPPALSPGEDRLGNIFLPGRLRRLTADLLFPVLEQTYPEPARPTPSEAEALLPRTLGKLRGGGKLRLLAWGDSVTDGSYLPHRETDRWQVILVERLRRRFPAADIELHTEAWPGRTTAAYLAEAPGSDHNYEEKVLGVKPDLVISEFVNDAGLSPEEVETNYTRFLADFAAIGAEWIVFTPHYVRPDWMGLTRQREIDDDPRPYVRVLREFAARHGIALADAACRWGRLWRQGIPYTTLLHNAINHPDVRGMRLYADSAMALFPARS